MKKMKKILVVLLAVVMLCQVFLCILPVAAADEEDLAYSNVWNDLQVSASFKAEYAAGEYPLKSNDYKLEVITIAESEAGELFVYVYQPGGEATGIRASSINIANVDRAMDEKDYSNYKLTYLNSHTVFFKYKVEGYTVPLDATASIEISSIYRPWSESYGDKKPGGDNTISEVAFAVGKLYTISGSSGSMSVQDIELIRVTEKYVGYERFMQDGFLNYSAYDAHFVAFSTDRKIEELLEADVAFTRQDYSQTIFSGGGSTNWSDCVPDKAYLDKDSVKEIEISDGLILKESFTLIDQIQSTSDFMKHAVNLYSFPGFSKADDIVFDEEGISQLLKTQWVLTFEVTEYYMIANDNFYQEKYTRIGDVTILRLKFKTDGKIYNLGVVDNKQTGSPDPSITFEKQEWWQKIMMVLMLILLLLALMFIWPIVSPVFRVIGIGIKNIFKILIWILMLPSKLFRKIFKLSDKHQSKRRKTSIQNTKGKVKK